MSKIKFVLNRNGVKELMRSQNMQSVLAEYADAVRSRTGDGYKSDGYIGRNRANAMVFADTYQAKRDNLKNNTLLKALR